MTNLINLAKNAKESSFILANASMQMKNDALAAIADALIRRSAEVIQANAADIASAKQRGISDALLDRLTLTRERIEDIAKGVRQVMELPDPIGEVISMWKRPNGLTIGQRRVPIGVIGIIYEARPNVTADAAALCLKSSNAVVLRGGSEAIHSNTAIVKIMRDAVAEAGLPADCVCLLEDTSRETAAEMMKLNEYIDLLIPRGGKGLIQSVVKNATVPVIQTGEGNCHVYIDGQCDRDMAMDITINAKVSRPAVCNAAETLLIDKAVADELLPEIVKALRQNGVEVRGCALSRKICGDADVLPATEEDFYTEYNDYIISVKVVDGIKEAIHHINRHGTKHSEAIVTTDYSKAQIFLQQIDAAAVYVNASTRFTDGFEFGFGAEIGISTQKMHARGPMGLKELTTIKYIIYGDGQVR